MRMLIVRIIAISSATQDADDGGIREERPSFLPFLHMKNNSVLTGEPASRRGRRTKQKGSRCQRRICVQIVPMIKRVRTRKKYGSNSYPKESSDNDASAISASYYHHYPLSSCARARASVFLSFSSIARNTSSQSNKEHRVRAHGPELAAKRRPR